jgi:hypothetical protein
MKIRFSRKRFRCQLHARASALANRYCWPEIGYYYFGEFGYLNLEVLGGLELLFKQHPQRRLRIATYANYAKLLEHMFPGRVACYAPSWQFASERRSQHRYHSAWLHWSLFWRGFTVPLQSLLDGLPNRGEINTARLFYLSEPLNESADSRPTKDAKRYISVFPRGRRGYFARKNLSVAAWVEILAMLATIAPFPVVLHGIADEMVNLPAAERMIRPRDVVEQIRYLRQSHFCISPDSGFVQFALNCACDVIVIGGTIQYHEFAAFNPFGARLCITCQNGTEYLPALRHFAVESCGELLKQAS